METSFVVCSRILLEYPSLLKCRTQWRSFEFNSNGCKLSSLNSNLILSVSFLLLKLFYIFCALLLLDVSPVFYSDSERSSILAIFVFWYGSLGPWIISVSGVMGDIIFALSLGLAITEAIRLYKLELNKALVNRKPKVKAKMMSPITPEADMIQGPKRQRQSRWKIFQNQNRILVKRRGGGGHKTRNKKNLE